MLSLVIGSSVWFAVLSVLVWLLQFSEAYRYDLAYVDYNLNQNQLATTPLEYWGEVSQLIASHMESLSGRRVFLINTC